jgi:hypothetical protein
MKIVRLVVVLLSVVTLTVLALMAPEIFERWQEDRLLEQLADDRDPDGQRAAAMDALARVDAPGQLTLDAARRFKGGAASPLATAARSILQRAGEIAE